MMSVSKDSAEFIIRVVKKLLRKYPLSSKFVDLSEGSEFYKDSETVLAMRAELRALVSSMETIVKLMDSVE